jgi:hypothetical protein
MWKTRQNHMQTCYKITEQSCDSGSHSTCIHRYISMVKISFAGSNSRQMQSSQSGCTHLRDVDMLRLSYLKLEVHLQR